MHQVHVRRLLSVPAKTFAQELKGQLLVTFDDGQSYPMTGKEIAVSRFAWELWVHYPDCPLTSALRANNFLSHGFLSNDTHGGLMRWAYRDIVNHHVKLGDDYSVFMDGIWKRIMRLINDYYNFIIIESEAYVQGYDILDMIQIARHPDVVQTIRSAPLSQDGVDSVYKAIKTVCFTPEITKSNPIAAAYVAGFIKRQQADQVLGVRGYLTDVNSVIFPKPIMTGFLEGLRVLADMMMESRSGAKALANSEAPLQQSEYFARRLHHIGAKVQRLHCGDCGSKRTFPWLVRDGYTRSTGEKIDSDLVGLEGKYYVEHGQLKILTTNDKHLLGTTIQMRSPNYPGGCLIPEKDPNGICEVCFGAIAMSVPAESNLGMYSTSVTAEKEGQGILSTKHHEGSSVVEGIVLTGLAAKLLWAEENGRDYYINKSVLAKSKSVYFTLTPSEISGITDIANAPDAAQLDIQRVSEFSDVVIHVVDEDGVDSTYELALTLNNRQPSLSSAMLCHIREHGYSVNQANGHFVFNLTGWDATKPMFTLPLRHFNMSDHQRMVEEALTGDSVASHTNIDAKEIESGTPKRRSRKGVKTELPIEAQLVALFDLIFTKLKTKLSTVEVIFLSMLASNEEDEPYKLYSGVLPADSEQTASKLTLRQHYRTGSVGVSMAYQEQESIIFSPASYLYDHRGIYAADHPLDWCLTPQEAYLADVEQGIA
jgi:hypothetical protein